MSERSLDQNRPLVARPPNIPRFLRGSLYASEPQRGLAAICCNKVWENSCGAGAKLAISDGPFSRHRSSGSLPGFAKASSPDPIGGRPTAF
jgi:hypothetical protein